MKPSDKMHLQHYVGKFMKNLENPKKKLMVATVKIAVFIGTN